MKYDFIDLNDRTNATVFNYLSHHLTNVNKQG